MKIVKRLLLVILLMIPVFIKALTFTDYNSSLNGVNNYINKYPDRYKYLNFNMPYENMPYEFKNGNSYVNTNFKRGGLLSSLEYNISVKGHGSYLATGREYWTLTNNGTNQYYIDNTILEKDVSEQSGIRVTQFVKPSVNVTGKGTYVNPWVFREQFSVEARSSSLTYGTVSPSEQMVDGGTRAKLVIKPITGYMYSGSDCSISKKTTYYETAPVKKDLICTINFEIRKIKINYSCTGGSGSVASQTVKYNDPYTIADYTHCTKTGYTQTGWKTSDNNAWNSGSYDHMTLENGERGLANDTLDLQPVWTANRYTITYYQGNGTSTAGTTKLGTQTCTYDSNCTLKSYSSFGKTLPNSTTPSGACDYQWSFYGWTDTQTSLERKYTNEKQFTYNKAGNLNLYVLETRLLHFNSGVAPTSDTTITQYWNPYSSSSDYVSAITVPNNTVISGWSFIGYKGGSSAAEAGVDYGASSPGTTVKPLPTTCRFFRSKYSRTLTISYDGNGATSGSVSNSTATQYYNSGYASSGSNVGAKVNAPEFTLRANGFSRTYYTFNKWAAGSTNGNLYAAGGKFSSFVPAVNGATTYTMYAKWTDTTKPSVTVTAKDYDNTSTVLKSAQTFTADGTFTVNSKWINKYVTFNFQSSDAQSGIKNIKWYKNETKSATDTGNTYQSDVDTFTSGFGSINKAFTASGYRKGKWVVTYNDGNVITITVVVKIDKTDPTCSLSASSTKVTLTKDDNYKLDSYNVSTSSSPSYSGNTSIDISKHTFYGYVKDEAGNTGSCSIIVAGTNAEKTKTVKTCKRKVVSYDKTVHKCTRSLNNYTKTTKSCSSSWVSNDVNCNTRAKYESPSSHCPSGYTYHDQTCKMTYGCSSGSLSGSKCYISATSHACTQYTSQNSCVSASDSCSWNGRKCIGTYYTCSSGWTRSGTQCWKNATNNYSGTIMCHKKEYSMSTSTSTSSSCSVGSSFSCNSSHDGRSYVSNCSANYNYSFNNTNSNGVSSCSASSSFSCNSSNYNSSYTTCSTNYNYYWDDNETTTSSCTATSSFSCNSSHVSDSYTTCETKYKCATGYTKINDTYCYKK